MSATAVPGLTQDAIEAAQDAVREFERAGLAPPRRLLIAAQRMDSTSATTGGASPDDVARPADD